MSGWSCPQCGAEVGGGPEAAAKPCAECGWKVEQRMMNPAHLAAGIEAGADGWKRAYFAARETADLLLGDDPVAAVARMEAELEKLDALLPDAERETLAAFCGGLLAVKIRLSADRADGSQGILSPQDGDRMDALFRALTLALFDSVAVAEVVSRKLEP